MVAVVGGVDGRFEGAIGGQIDGILNGSRGGAWKTQEERKDIFIF